MIIAELNGKLDSSASSYEVSEDILTSNVFQLLRYLPPSNGIMPFINEVFANNKSNVRIDESVEWKVEYYFWPRGMEKKREPDLLIQFISAETSYTVVIEAKYYSGPSDNEQIDEVDGSVSGNQLADQFVDLQKGVYSIGSDCMVTSSPRENRFLLYLTKHTSVPDAELLNAEDQYKHSKNNDKTIIIKNHLLWANWPLIWKVLKINSTEQFPYSMIQKDLVSLLERKGFKYFSGFRCFHWDKTKCKFWDNKWFNVKSDYQFNNEGKYFQM